MEIRNKFGAKKVIAGGYTFASKLEHAYYCELKIRERMGEIEGIEVHPKFDAIVNGTKVCTIILDFRHYDKKEQRLVYTDTKGVLTAVSRLKIKLLEALYPEIKVHLVYDAM